MSSVEDGQIGAGYRRVRFKACAQGYRVPGHESCTAKRETDLRGLL